MADKTCTNSRSCSAGNNTSLQGAAANAVLGTVTGSGTNDKSTCIDVSKIYDSAKDKECIEDLRVYLGPEGQELIDRYSIQLELYKRALESATDMKVKEVLIYAFALSETIKLF